MIVNVKSGRHVKTGQCPVSGENIDDSQAGHCPVSTNHTTQQTPMFIKINETVVGMKPIEQILANGFCF